MALIQSFCCYRSLRKGCYASAGYTLVYFTLVTATMIHFLIMEVKFLRGEIEEPVSNSFLEPSKITPVTVTFNLILLACSVFGLIASVLLIYAVYQDYKYLLLPWIVVMVIETGLDVANTGYLLYLQSLSFNPITSILFTLDFFLVGFNSYSIACVISQLQEYFDGRGTEEYDYADRVVALPYPPNIHHTMTSSSAISSRRRSTGRPMPSRCDFEDFSEVSIPMRMMSSSMSKPIRPGVKKHVQFPDEQSCIAEAALEITETDVDAKPERRVISSLWMELESEVPPPER